MYFCARVSLIRPAPNESPRSGMKQGCLVVAVRYWGLPFFLKYDLLRKSLKMKLLNKIFLFCFLLTTFTPVKLLADDIQKADTVKTGIYIISVHDIDFHEREYSINFWVWMRYKNPEFKFAKNIEIPNSKSFIISDITTDSTDGEIFTIMKLKCVMKQSWRVHNYPFDKQKLKIHIENSQFDSKSLVFVADTNGKQFDPKLTVSGWDIANISISTGIQNYETAFGDVSQKTPHSEYGKYMIELDIERNAWGLFLKLFLGMYVAFLITYVSIFIHADNIDSRFGLSVGALFAAVGNKYIIDSLLPESSNFTLVDSLHAFTFISILVTISLSVYALKLLKEDKLEKANRIDKLTARILLSAYVFLNLLFVGLAIFN